MTKKAVLVGLAMAVAVLLIAFLINKYRNHGVVLDETEQNVVPPPAQSSQSNDNPAVSASQAQASGDSTSNIDAALNDTDSDLKSVNSSDFDPNAVQ